MKKFLEDLYKSTKNPNSNAIVFPNPDSFTIQFLKEDIRTAVASIVEGFNVSFEEEIKTSLSNISLYDDWQKLIPALKSCTNEDYQNVATILEDGLAKVDGINLDGKSIPAILLATTIFGFITESRQHENIAKFKDPLEKTIITYLYQLSAEEGRKVSVLKLKNETFGIFKNTEFEIDVFHYLARAFAENEAFNANPLGKEWYDFETLDEIPLSKETDITNDNLYESLKTFSPSKYQQAIEFVADTHFPTVENAYEKRFKSAYVVAVLAGKIASNTENLPERDYANISFNLAWILYANQSAVEKSLKNTNQATILTQSYGDALNDLYKQPIATAMDIDRLANSTDLEHIDLFDDSFEPEDDINDEQMQEVKASPIKKVSKERYILSYISTYQSLISLQIQDLDAKLTALRKIWDNESTKYTQMRAKIIADYAKEFDVESNLQPYTSPKTEQLITNAKMVHMAIRASKSILLELSGKDGILEKVKRKLSQKIANGEPVDEEYFLSKSFLKEKFGGTEKEHIELIKEFYEFLSSDPLLKNETNTYVLAPREVLLAKLKQRASNSPEFTFVSTASQNIKVKNLSKAQALAYDLYVNEDGSVNEEMEDLYLALTKGKTKDLAIWQAQIDKLISPEEAKELLALLPARESKKKGKDNSRLNQITIDEIEQNTEENVNNDAEDEDGIEQ